MQHSDVRERRRKEDMRRKLPPHRTSPPSGEKGDPPGRFGDVAVRDAAQDQEGSLLGAASSDEQGRGPPAVRRGDVARLPSERSSQPSVSNVSPLSGAQGGARMRSLAFGSREDQLTLSGKVDELATHAMLMECLHSDELGSLVEERGFTVESMDAKHCAVKFGSDAKVDMPGQEEAVDAAMDKALDELDTSQWNPKAQAEHQLWQRTRASGFNFNANGAKGNPMASRFRRACEKDPDGLGADYKAKEGDTDEAAAFRAKWAREKYGNYREGKIKRETYTKTSWKQGQYIPIGRVAHLEGGGVLGWLQATATGEGGGGGGRGGGG
eukprot:6809871-Pyramimonas_sp.AAC.3